MWLWDFQKIGEKRDSTLGHTKRLSAPGPKGKEQWPHRRQSQTYFLVLEGLLQKKGVAVAMQGQGHWQQQFWVVLTGMSPHEADPYSHHKACRLQRQVSSVQSLRHVQHFSTPWIAARQASMSITNHQTLLKLISIRSVMPSSHLILCRPFSSCTQSLRASGSFPMSQLFA